MKLSNVGEGQRSRLYPGREVSPQHFLGLVGGDHQSPGGWRGGWVLLRCL